MNVSAINPPVISYNVIVLAENLVIKFLLNMGNKLPSKAAIIPNNIPNLYCG